jgi:hypothetical protein
MVFTYDLEVSDQVRSIVLYRIKGWTSQNPISRGDRIYIENNNGDYSTGGFLGEVENVFQFQVTDKETNEDERRKTSSRTRLSVKHPGMVSRGVYESGRVALEKTLEEIFGDDFEIVEKSSQ